ncbi:MAG: DUF4097 family beta strand repeat-containing protein [candidate division Zixibacteria bacterium]|nr:DUF4097 family beta strand repeat-containing protein [candidate division Zixibacteria bacterium]
MKKSTSIMVVIGLAVIFLASTAFAYQGRKITETFDKKSRIKISTVSGDCIVKKGTTDKIEVEVENSYTPQDNFEAELYESGKTLHLAELIHGNTRGGAIWTITAPDGIKIEFSTASGRLVIRGLQGEFEASTASGEIEIIDCGGEFHFSTASGDISARNCTGAFDLSTASGEIMASSVTLDEPGSFSTASGTAEVHPAKTPEFNLSVSSASGSAIVDYDGNPVKGTFEFTAKKRNGEIDAPFAFDHEEEFRRYGDRYVRKTFTKETDGPLIEISTASGEAILK